MVGEKNKVMSGSILAILLIICLGITDSLAGPPRLAQVIYITMSQACACTLERCQAGDVVVGNLFNGKESGLLKRIDYATDKNTAKTYMSRYRVIQAPALLFLDDQNNMLWLAMGELSEPQIAAKLKEFGS